MAEDRTHFKIKKGDVEIEFEGRASEADKKYKEAFDWITASPINPMPTPQDQKKQGDISKDKKWGGARSNIVSKAVDKLIDEHWIGKSKKIPEVVAELRRRVVPGATRKTVYDALNRRVGKTLDRIKDNNGQWAYSEKEIA
jgi:radical SAM superfamily enzyme YgiQ (UPF0313 family)